MTKPHTTLSEAVRAMELPDSFEIYWPELNRSALGCGVEDRGLRDRYECAEYGWQDGVDKAIERVPEKIYTEDDVRALIATIASMVEQHEAQEPVAWRYQRDTQSRPGVGDGQWRAMTDCKMALELQGKAPVGAPYIANSSYHCWEPLYAQPTLAATHAGDVKVISIGHGATLQRQAKTTGAVGWLMYNEHGLVRSLDVFETQLVESALAAMSPTTTRSE